MEKCQTFCSDRPVCFLHALTGLTSNGLLRIIWLERSPYGINFDGLGQIDFLHPCRKCLQTTLPRGKLLVEPVECCCTVGHITACYSRHDSDILLTQTSWAQVGSRENSLHHPLCTAHLNTICVVFHSWRNTASACRSGLFQHADCARELKDSKSATGSAIWRATHTCRYAGLARIKQLFRTGAPEQKSSHETLV